MNRVCRGFLVACGLLALSGVEGSLVDVVEAGVPRIIHYQGKITETDGTPLAGDHTVRLRLYDAATEGAQLWEEQHQLSFAADDNGVFSLTLGSLTPFSTEITFNDPLWLTIEVDGGGEFSPRLPLAAASYAINADQLDGQDSASFLQLDASGLVPNVKLSTSVSLLGSAIESAEVTDSTLSATDTTDTFLAAGSGVTVLKAAGSWTVSASGGATGDITAVTAGAGLTGGGTSGDVTLAVDAGTTADKIVQLDATAALPAVSGANLTNLNASNLASGTVADAQLSANVSLLGSAIESAEVTDSTLSATDTTDTFLAAGSGVTVLKAAGSWTVSASGGATGDITAVTAGAGLTGGGTSGDVTLAVDAGTTADKIVQLDATAALPAVSGANLTNLNASNLASGTVADAQLSANVSLLGSAIESAEVTDSTLTAADTAAAFLTAGSGITVTKGASSWDIAATAGGDITGVTAGTGLTGGGASGDVTLSLATPVAVPDGGTGASTAAAARSNLVAAASGANSDITSLSGLTTPLSITQGGTGATTAADARAHLINCMPLGGVAENNQNSTFQIATFGVGGTSGRPDHLWPVPVSGTVSSLRVFIGAAPGASASWTVTVRKNDANTSLFCAISGSSQTSCTASGTVSLVGGDRLGVQFVEGGNAANTVGAGWSACFIPN